MVENFDAYITFYQIVDNIGSVHNTGYKFSTY